MEEQSSNQNGEVSAFIPTASLNVEPRVVERPSGHIDQVFAVTKKRANVTITSVVAVVAIVVIILLLVSVSYISSSTCECKSLDDAAKVQDVTTPSILNMEISTATSSVMDKISTQTPRVQLVRSFQFYMDLDKEYESAFNNRSSPTSQNFIETFQTEMDDFYKSSADIQSLYVRTEVDQLRLKGTITRIEFTIYVQTDWSQDDVILQLTINIPELSYKIFSYCQN